MKPNFSEKKLLAIVVFIGILLLGYFTIVEPEIKLLNRTLIEKSVYDMKVMNFKADLAAENQMMSTLSDMEEALKVKAAAYYPEIRYEKLILTLNDLLNSTGLKSTSIVFGAPEVRSVVDSIKTNPTTITQADTYVNAYGKPAGVTVTSAPATATAAPAAATSADANMVYTSTANMVVEGSYNQVYDFIQNFKNIPRKQVVQQISLTRNDNGTVKGNIRIDFYAIPKLVLQDEDYINWQFNYDKGLDNPFTGN